MLNHPSWWSATDIVRKQDFLHIFFYYIYRVEWRKGKWQHTLPVQHIFSISAYTGCNYPLMLVCTSITLTCFIKLLLRFSWKGSQSHSPFCWLYYSLPAILVLTLQSGYLSLNVITMWSQNPHIYHYNCIQMMGKMNVKCLCYSSFFRTEIYGHVKITETINYKRTLFFIMNAIFYLWVGKYWLQREAKYFSHSLEPTRNLCKSKWNSL